MEDPHILRSVRETKGITQAELAKSIGVTRSYLCLIEKKSRSGSIHFWRKASQALEVSVSDLIADPLTRK